MGAGVSLLVGRARAASTGAKAAAIGVAAVLALATSAGLMGGASSGGGESGSVECHMKAGSSEVPGDYFPWLQEAAVKYRLGPEGASVVAAIHWRESEWDQSPLPGVAPGTQNSAGAEGPGQFLVSSWEAYGVDADGNGVKDPYSIPDSVFATARLLHADGAPADWRDAIWDYNHAWWYVEEVLEKAAELRSGLVCEGTSVLPAGSAQTLERIKSVATWIESKEIHYCWGGGHGLKPGPSSGILFDSDCPFGTQGLDCSGSVRWLMVLSGYPDPGGLRSDQLGAVYPSGRGREVTIWSNVDHVWMEIEGRDWGTATSNPFGGPGWGPQTVEGFVPSHPPGL
jgi:hypothetical protein